MSAEKEGASLAKPEAVLFDWDGTLVDSHPVLAAAMNHTLEFYGRAPWTYEEWQAWLGLSARDAFPKEFGDDWEDAQKIYLDAYGKLHLEKIQLLEGATELITMLVNESLPLAVVSNKTGHYLRAEAAHFGWDYTFVTLVGSGDSRADKPAADPIHDAMRSMNLQPGETTWFIGDNEVDVACGRAAGCTTILVGESYLDSYPHHRVSNLIALRNLILKKLN
ncbi:MAG: HAD hydrolase-like protein [Rhodospirillaceae bacterium]|nr:HAD hydrolase-like protein [Rhodospirillaceae bacterium]